MTTVSKKQSMAKRAPTKKPRKNARPDKNVIVVPKGGPQPLLARIGDPFSPMDLRQLINQARQEDPSNVDETLRKIVDERTAKQLDTLLRRLGLEPTDPDKHSSAFVILAMALCGVGQVAWTPAAPQTGSWTHQHESTLFWLVRSLCEDEKLTERAAVKKIADDAFLHRLFPYQPRELKRDAKLSKQERKFQSLRQAWTSVKTREGQFLATGRPQLIDAIVGKEAGYWETKLVTLDIANAAPRSGKSRAR